MCWTSNYKNIVQNKHEAIVSSQVYNFVVTSHPTLTTQTSLYPCNQTTSFQSECHPIETRSMRGFWVGDKNKR